MNLREGSLLQSGRYRIEKVLGQGGFGITYSGYQTNLEAKVAIKEFFMKDLCNRDATTSQVSVGSVGSRETVETFRQKFLKEARNIFRLKHKHIISVIDVFEENGTAYYVMEHVGGGSLAGKVLHGALPEEDAVRYTRQVADALAFVHSKRMMHLDVKPANILLDDNDNAVLIDFGLAKQYDTEGHQTSSTPVGISHGYAPLEQYKRGGVSTFSPATDIYSLGATLFKLVTGITPPEASDVNDEGLPVLPSDISAPVRRAIEAAMQPRRKDRPQSVAEFLSLLESTDNREQGEGLIDDADVEVTVLPESGKIKDERLKIKEQSENFDRSQKAKAIDEQSEATRKTDNEETRALEKEPEQVAVTNNEPAEPKKNRTAWVVAVVVLLGVLVGGGLFFAFSGGDGSDYPVDDESEQGISTSKKVDLGLSVCWAGWNVGASSPEGYGNYYAWGETTTKSEYGLNNYQYFDGNYYVNIGCNISGTQYDAACAQWSGCWRLPTHAECQELIDHCTWTWTTYNNVNGYKVTGPNGNSIFLPVAGYRLGTELYDRASRGLYWSGSLNESSYGYSYYLHFDSSGRYVKDNHRGVGHVVRPVCNK